MGSARGTITSLFAFIGLVAVAAGLFCTFYWNYEANVQVSSLFGTSFYVNVNATYKAIWWSWEAHQSLDDFYRDDSYRRDGRWFLTINGEPSGFVRSSDKVFIGSGTEWTSQLSYLYNPLSG